MEDINLDFRPDSYFRPQKLTEHLISKVKGAVLRDRLQQLYDTGRHNELERLLGANGISLQDSKALGGIHPMYMGGNYLPDTEVAEVEIARICIESTTYDVVSVYARKNQVVTVLRVVDEYDGDTLEEPTCLESNRPLTLGELADFFLNAWSLIEVLEANFGDDVEAGLNFFRADSKFYPDFDRLCRARVIEYYGKREK